MTWVDAPVDGSVLVQCSAHGAPRWPRSRDEVSTRARSRWSRTSHSAVSRRARASSSTTATTRGCSAAGSAADGGPTPKSAVLSLSGRNAAQVSGKDAGLGGRPSSRDREAAALAAASTAPGRLGATETTEVDGSTVRLGRRERKHRGDGLGGRHLDRVAAGRAGEVGGSVWAGSERDVASWAVRSGKVSARTTGSWSTMPAGTSTNQRCESRCHRGPRNTPRPRRLPNSGPPASHDRVASSSGPTTSAGAHINQTTGRGLRRRACETGNAPRRRRRKLGRTGVRSRRRLTTAIGDRRRETEAEQIAAGTPATAAPTAAMIASGAPMRTTVSDRTEAIASPSASPPRSPSSDRRRPGDGRAPPLDGCLDRAAAEDGQRESSRPGRPTASSESPVA